MNDHLADQFVKQLDSVSEDYSDLKRQSKYDDVSDMGDSKANSLIARSRAAIERASGKDSPYTRQATEILDRRNENDFGKVGMIIGVVESLSFDIQSGYMSSASELIHGEIFHVVNTDQEAGFV